MGLIYGNGEAEINNHCKKRVINQHIALFGIGAKFFYFPSSLRLLQPNLTVICIAGPLQELIIVGFNYVFIKNKNPL